MCSPSQSSSSSTVCFSQITAARASMYQSTKWICLANEFAGRWIHQHCPPPSNRVSRQPSEIRNNCNKHGEFHAPTKLPFGHSTGVVGALPLETKMYFHHSPGIIIPSTFAKRYSRNGRGSQSINGSWRWWCLFRRLTSTFPHDVIFISQAHSSCEYDWRHRMAGWLKYE